MSQRIELHPPLQGLSENVSFDDQPPLTTTEVFNMRGIDPETGRVRLSKRAGSSKQHVDRISASAKIADVASVRYPQKTVDYTLTTTSLWDTPVPAKADVLMCETDLEGNVYALNGTSGVVKYSADGVEVYAYTVAVPSGSVLGALDVDEGANVYTGVSGFREAPQGLLGSKEPGNGMIVGDMDKAQLWKLEHAFRNNDDENEPELSVAWTLTMKAEDPGPTLRGLVGYVRCKGAKLYTLQHDNRQWKSWLVVYDAIHSGVPFEALVQEVPYPASSLDVDTQGRIVITVENFTRRGENPAHPESLAALVGWTLKDIDEDVTGGQKKHRIWFDLDPTKPETLETTGGIIPEDGDEVLFARDANGSGRVLVFATPDGKRGPTWKKEGLGGKPELYFNGSTQLLYTGLSPSSDADFRDGGLGLFPTYKDPDNPNRSSQYAVVALMRPEAKTDGTTLTNQMPAWSHSADNPSLSDQTSLLINRGVATGGNLDTLASATNHVTNAVSWYCRADASDPGQGSATGLMPSSYQPSGSDLFGPFNSGANAMLISLIACNGVDPGAGDTKTRSLIRVWGRPIDRFMQDPDANVSVAKQWLGGSAHADFSTLAPMYRGSVCRIVVLDRKHQDVVGPLSICSHPAGPDSTTGNIVGAVTIVNEGAVAASASGNLTFTPTGAPPTIPASGTWQSLNGVLTSITLTSSGEGYDARPNVVATGFAGAGAALQAGMEYKAGTKQSPTVLEKIEGMLAWERGVAYLLHSAGFYVVQRVNSFGTVGTYSWNAPHPYFYVPNVVSPFISDQGPPENENTIGLHKFSHKGELLIFMDASGKFLDVLSHELNGIGLGCRFNADGTLIYTAGSSAGTDGEGLSTAANAATVRKIVVKADGKLGWTAPDGGSGIASGLQMSGQRCGLKVDAANNVYVPINAPIDFTDPTCATFAVLSDAGVLIHAFLAGPAGAQNQGAFCIALPRVLEKADPIPFTPDYEGDVASKVVEHLFIAGAAASYDGGTVHSGLRKYRLVLATPNNDPPRLHAHLAVAGGTVTRFDGPSLAVPTGGTAALSATAYIHSVAAGQKLYYADGATYKVFDPKLNEVTDWEAERGEIPPRCRIAEFWRGRNILCGDGTGAVFGSRVLKPNDWDREPPVPTPVQAFEFAKSQVGDVPDSVTAFMPYNDDLATIGGDHSLYSLRGDPMAGGQLDLRSDVTGMAFGRPWARDATGAGWFIGSRGGLFRQANPLALPERVSLMKIERRLQEIDFATYYFRLAYDPQREGVWIMQLPFGTLDVARIETYFYEIKTDAFWADFIDEQEKQVTALHVIDGDGPSDRRILTGHGDGWVRYIDDANTTDDGTAIQASIVMGPYKGQVEGYEIRVTKLGMVLASTQSGGATWRVYANDTPDDKGVAVRSGSFGPGNNLVASARARGSYFWLELSQTGSPSRFALERAYLEWEQAGRQRVRA